MQKSFFLAVLVLTIGVAARAQTVIDNFDKNQVSVSQTGAGTASSTQTGSMLGGERDLKVALSAGGTLSGEAKLGQFFFSRGSGVSGNLEIVWDGPDGNAAAINQSGLGSLNLTSGGQNALLLGVNSSDAAASVAITIYSGSGTKTYTLPIPAGITTPTWFQIAYSDAGWSGSGVFTTVGAVQMVVSSASTANVVFDFLRTSSTAAPATPEATLTDVLLVDADNNGKVSAGDTIKYIARIKNTGATAISNVQFSAPAVANASAAANITATPLAQADAPSGTSSPGEPFHGAWNTSLNIAAGSGLLANDFLGTPAASIASFGVTSFAGTSVGEGVTAHAAGTSSTFGGNSLTVNADGSLSLVPSSTFTGLIIFQYRLSNAAGASDATATVAVGIRPTASADSYSVTGNTMIDTTLGGLSTLLANDTGDQLSVTGNTAPTKGTIVRTGANFSYLPNVGYTGADSFTYTLHNGFGDVSGTVNLTVANPVWYIDNSVASNGDGRSSNPFKQTSDFTTANDGAATHPKDGEFIFLRQGSGLYTGSVTLRNGQTLIGDGSSGTLASQLGIVAGSAKGAGIALPEFTGTDPVITPAAGNGVNLAAANTLRGFTVSNNSGFAFSGTAAGNLILAECSKTGTGGAMSITTSGAFGSNVSFDTLESTSSTGANLSLTGVTGTLSVTSAGNGFSGSAASSGAVVISGGSLSFSYAGNITKANTGRLFDVQNRTAGTLTFSGNLSGSGGSNGILCSGNSGGTITFSGGSKTLNTITLAAVTLNSNAGATINFTGGGLVITTTSGAGINATGGGTVTVQGSGNTISSTTGTALTVSSTTIGASGLTFQSVSANGAANGIVLSGTGSGGLTVTGTGTTAGSGGTIQNTSNRGASIINAANISLKNMNFVNAGNVNLVDPSAGAGGVSPGEDVNYNLNANAGIHLVNVNGATLDRISVTGGAQQGINGNNVTNFVLSNSTVQGNGNEVREDGLHFKDMLGTSSISNCTFGGNTAALNNAAVQIHIENYSGGIGTSITLDSVNVQSRGFAASGVTWSHGLLFGLHSAGNADLTVKNSTFNNLFSNSIQADSDSTGVFEETINDNIFTNVGASAITSALNSNGTLRSYIHHNGTAGTPITRGSNTGASHSININHAGLAGASSVLEATINNNLIGDNSNSTSANAAGDGIRIFSVSSGTATVKINNNTILNSGANGIDVQLSEDTASTHTINATIFNNTVTLTDVNSFDGIRVVAGATSSGGGDRGTLRLDMHDNSASATAGGNDFTVRQRFLTTVQLLNYAGANNDNTAVQTYLDVTRVNNPVGPGTDWFISNSTALAAPNGPGGGFVNIASVPQPTLPSP